MAKKLYFRVDDVFNAIDSFEMLGVRSEADEIHKILADTLRRMLYGLEMVPALEADEIEDQATRIEEQIKQINDLIIENEALIAENEILKVLPEPEPIPPAREYPEQKSGRGILARIRDGRRTK